MTPSEQTLTLWHFLGQHSHVPSATHGIVGETWESPALGLQLLEDWDPTEIGGWGGGVTLCSWMSQEERPGLVGFNPVEVNGKATRAKRENKRNGMAQRPERAAKIQT